MKGKSIYILGLLLLLRVAMAAQVANPVGDAVDLGSDCFRITNAQQTQNGAVWYTEQLDLSQYFSLTVDINLGNNDGGADGIMLVMQQVGLDAIGLDGSGLGFAGFSPSFGLEFDTFNNTGDINNGDLAADHMAMLLNGNIYHNNPDNIAGPVSIIPGGANAENGQNINLRLVWNPDEQRIKAFMDCELRLSAEIDLVSDVFQGESLVYWGFTGATGFYSNVQTVCFLEAAYLNESTYETICLGDQVDLMVQGLGAENIEWLPNETVNNPNSAFTTAEPEENTVYTVNYEKCGESFSDTTYVDVIILDIEPINNQEICEGESAVFNAVYDEDYDVEWSSGVTEEDTSTFSTAGTHWVEVSDGLCLRREYFDLNFSTPPLIDLPPEVEYCYADSTLISFTAENSDLFLPSGTPGNSFYVSSEGAYEVTAVHNDTGCLSTAQVEGVELPLPIISLNSVYEICPYEEQTVSVSSGFNSTWSNGESGNSITLNDPGIYQVISELNGCLDSSTFELIVNPLPNTSLGGSYTFCEDTTFTITSLNDHYSVLWHNGEESSSFTFEESGVHEVLITDTASGCFTVEQIEVEKILNPIIDINPSYDLCTGDIIDVSPFYENADSLVWSFGHIGEEYTFREPEAFFVSAENSCLRVEATSEIIGITCDCEAFLPLAFTPDNDGVNEVFFPHLRCEPFDYSLVVFDRWGDVVFSSVDPSESWNGSYKGGDHYVSPGVFNYILSYKSEQFDGLHTQIKRGTVSVIR